MSQLLYRARRQLWMDPGPAPRSFRADSPCCAEMEEALRNVCEEHAGDPFACPDMLIAYSPAFDEYGLIIHDGSGSTLAISACPFCGTKLPASRRDEWFDRLEALGFDDPLAADIPAEYRSSAWWRKE